MKKIIALAVVTVCSSCVFAQTSGNLYGEVAYQTNTIKDTSTDNLGTFKPTSARFTIGKVVTENVAVEGFYTQGMSDKTNTYTSPDSVTIKLNNAYGVAIRPFINITNSVELFGRLGTSRVKSSWSATSNSGPDSGSDTFTNNFYGIGAGYKMTKDVSLILDYTKNKDHNSSTSSAISAGLRFNF